MKQWLARLFGANPVGVLFVGVFLVGAAAFGVEYAMLVPPGQAADEQAHIFRAYSIGRGQITGHPLQTRFPDGLEAPATSVRIDPMLGAIMLSVGPAAPKAIKLPDLSLSTLADWSYTRVPASISVTGASFPLLYLPAATVMTLSQPLALLPMQAVQIGRLAELGAFLLLGSAALLLAEHGRAVFLSVLLLPATLALAGSVNPDGLLIATAVLAAALLTRADARLDAGGGPQSRGWHAAAATLGILVLVRPACLPLLSLLMWPLPAPRHWRAMRAAFTRRCGTAAVYLLPALAWCAYVACFVLTADHRAAYPAGPWWRAPGQIFHTTDAIAQIEILLADPWRLVALMVDSIHPTAAQMIGRLGLLDVQLPPWLYTAWSAAAVLALLSECVGRRGTGRPARIADIVLIATAAILALAGIVLWQYLSWTPVGAIHAEGVEPRYFLPLLPFAVLAMPRIGLPGGGYARLVGLAAPGLAAVAVAMAMPFRLLYIYYLR